MENTTRAKKLYSVVTKSLNWSELTKEAHISPTSSKEGGSGD